MDYRQLFRNLREARGLTLEQLARLAHVHRNTVVNIESGRQVRIKTIAALVRKMGYGPESPEMRSIALLWLESTSGLSFTRPEAEASALKLIAHLRGAARERAAALQHALADANLSATQIDTLIHTVREPALLAIVEQIRDLAADLAAGESDRTLQAAETKAPYGGKK